VVRFYQEYVEPDESTSVSQPSLRRDVNPLHPTAPPSTDEEKVVIPLGENILAQNLGIPIVVVLTKVGLVSCILLSCRMVGILFISQTSLSFNRNEWVKELGQVLSPNLIERNLFVSFLTQATVLRLNIIISFCKDNLKCV